MRYKLQAAVGADERAHVGAAPRDHARERCLEGSGKPFCTVARFCNVGFARLHRRFHRIDVGAVLVELLLAGNLLGEQSPSGARS